MSSSNKQHIEQRVLSAYIEHGQASAFMEANKYPEVVYEYCNACETDSPTLDHECLICGQETKEDTWLKENPPFGFGQ